ncbi:MAG: ankyrin repeat domain-containing protein [Planctomycetes bacterium]|nr:ankyrin repeat domain-containing protein [Planctomycetota bacterium]
MNKRVLVILSCVLAISGASQAAGLDLSQVPEDAKWVFHVDAQRLAQSEITSMILAGLDDAQQKKLDFITTLTGSDPTKDFHGITLYGADSKEENAVVLISGRFDKERLLSMLATSSVYSESQYKDHTLYHWLDENDNKHKVGMFAADNLVVISQSPQAVQDTADLLAGGENTLAAQADAPLAKLTEAPQDAIMVIAADGLSELHKNDAEKAILRNSKMMAVLGGETNANLYLSIDLTAETPAAAMQIEAGLTGIRSFVTLKYASQPKVMALLESTKLQRNDNQLSVTVQYPSAKLYEIIKAKFQMDIWKAAAEGNTEAIAQQLAAGTDINAKESGYDSTPLITAAVYGQTEAAALLIEKGADLSARNRDGATALHQAAFFAHPDIVKLLLDNGADASLRNNRGETAYDTVGAPWSPELAETYKWLEGVLQTEMDLERIKAARPKAAELLGKNK